MQVQTTTCTTLVVAAPQPQPQPQPKHARVNLPFTGSPSSFSVPYLACLTNTFQRLAEHWPYSKQPCSFDALKSLCIYVPHHVATLTMVVRSSVVTETELQLISNDGPGKYAPPTKKVSFLVLIV